MLPVLPRMLLSSQMKEIASNKGEKVQPQVCVAGLSQRKFSVNDLQVKKTAHMNPFPNVVGAGSVTRARRYRSQS